MRTAGKFPGGNRRDMADDRNQVPAAARLDLQDGKAIVLIVEGYALDRADKRFPVLCFWPGVHDRSVSLATRNRRWSLARVWRRSQ